MYSRFIISEHLLSPHPKPSPWYFGPYEVIKHYKNSVTARHLVMANAVIYSIENLIVFTEDPEAAKDAT